MLAILSKKHPDESVESHLSFRLHRAQKDSNTEHLGLDPFSFAFPQGTVALASLHRVFTPTSSFCMYPQLAKMLKTQSWLPVGSKQRDVWGLTRCELQLCFSALLAASMHEGPVSPALLSTSNSCYCPSGFWSCQVFNDSSLVSKQRQLYNTVLVIFGYILNACLYVLAIYF